MIDLKRGQVWVHIINICASMAIFTAALSFTHGVLDTIQRAIDRVGTDLVLVRDANMPSDSFHSNSYPGEMNWRTYEMLKNALGDQYAIAPVSQFYGMVTDGAYYKKTLQAWIVNSDFFDVVKLPLAEGRVILPIDTSEGSSTCVLSGDIDGQERNMLGSRLQIDNNVCNIVGIAAPTWIAQQYSTRFSLFVSEASIKGLGDLDRQRLTAIFLRKRGGGFDADIESRIHDATRGSPAKLEVWSSAEFWKAREKIIHSVGALIIMIAGFILALSAIGLANGLLLDVTLRRGEIGLRFALGATPADIFRMVMIEGAAVVGLGGCAGIFFGAILVYLVIRPLASATSIYDQLVVVNVDAGSIALCFGVLLLVALIASFLPARNAARTEPSIALRDL